MTAGLVKFNRCITFLQASWLSKATTSNSEEATSEVTQGTTHRHSVVSASKTAQETLEGAEENGAKHILTVTARNIFIF